MPFEESPDVLSLTPEPPRQGRPGEGRGFWGILGAGLAQESEVVAPFLRNDWGIDNTPLIGYKVHEDIKGYEEWADQFERSYNPKMTAAIKLNIDQQLARKRDLDAAGLGGFLAQGIGGLMSPTTFIPGAGLYRVAKGTYGITRSGLAVGATTAGSILPQEAVLQLVQETRTATESMMNIGSGLVLGGLLGGSAAAILNRAGSNAAARAAKIDIKSAEEGIENFFEGPKGGLSADVPAAPQILIREDYDITGGAITQGLHKAAKYL